MFHERAGENDETATGRKGDWAKADARWERSRRLVGRKTRRAEFFSLPVYGSVPVCFCFWRSTKVFRVSGAASVTAHMVKPLASQP
jgi:hypothetical protein